MSFIPEIELADLQAVESAIEEKIRYYKANYPDDRMAITDMRNALQVLYDLEEDLDFDDDPKEGEVFRYYVDYEDGGMAWGFVCEEDKEKAKELVRERYSHEEEITEIFIDQLGDEDEWVTMEIGDIDEAGEG